MNYLVLADRTLVAHARALAESIASWDPSAQVQAYCSEPQPGHPEEVRSLWTLPAGVFGPGPDGARLLIEGVRWEDLYLCLGAVGAAWASLPWIIAGMHESWDRSGADLVVLDATFEMLRPPTGGELGASGSLPWARPASTDSDGRVWGGFEPGLLILPAEAANPRAPWWSWWRDRVAAYLRTTDPSLDGTDDSAVAPWWDLPTGTGAILSESVTGDLQSLLGSRSGPLLVDMAGLDPRAPWAFVPPTLDAAARDRLQGICRGRSTRMLGSGMDDQDPGSPGSVMPGVTDTYELRRFHRRMLSASLGEPDSPLPPNPYVTGEVGDFVAALGAPTEPTAKGPVEYIDQVFARRHDVAAAFSRARWADAGSLNQWTWSHGLSDGETSLVTLVGEPAPVGSPVRASAVGERPFGVNLVGYLGAELGLGVAARRMREALRVAGVPFAEVSYDRTSSRQSELSGGPAERLSADRKPYHFNLLLITPDQLPLFVADIGADFLAGHHNIGLWYWESDVMSPQQAEALTLVDEIWVATEYLTRAFSGHGLPVSVVPSPLVFNTPDPTTSDRSRHGLDDRFTFLFSYDFLSVAERKNPLGLIEAYQRAFPEPGSTHLVLKSINGDLFPEKLAQVRWVAADRDDITVRDEMLDPADRLGLVAAADCYVSLHRSEGLGLTMAEAMAVGTPVVATAYSGNLDFMPPGSAMLVPATEEVVGPGHYYPPEGHWGAPDLDAAAEAMVAVATDAQLRRSLVERGAEALVPFSYETVGRIATEALLGAWERR
ncbi:MAG: glycosyltransferase [Microthrixaceae bacterium]